MCSMVQTSALRWFPRWRQRWCRFLGDSRKKIFRFTAISTQITLERKHTHVAWLRFLKQIDSETPDGLAIHIIADNYATHKHAKVRA